MLKYPIKPFSDLSLQCVNYIYKIIKNKTDKILTFLAGSEGPTVAAEGWSPLQELAKGTRKGIFSINIQNFKCLPIFSSTNQINLIIDQQWEQNKY